MAVLSIPVKSNPSQIAVFEDDESKIEGLHHNGVLLERNEFDRSGFVVKGFITPRQSTLQLLDKTLTQVWLSPEANGESLQCVRMLNSALPLGQVLRFNGKEPDTLVNREAIKGLPQSVMEALGALKRESSPKSHTIGI